MTDQMSIQTVSCTGWGILISSSLNLATKHCISECDPGQEVHYFSNDLSVWYPTLTSSHSILDSIFGEETKFYFQNYQDSKL